MFFLVRLVPGDPVLLMAGERGLDPVRYAQLKAQYGFDRPIVIQYFDYLMGVLRGDLGRSLVTREPVFDEFMALFPATAELGLVAVGFALVFGLPLGAIAAAKRGGWVDQLAMSFSLVGYSMPIFWWALLLISFFSVALGWTPVSGRLSPLFFVEPVTGFMVVDTLLSGEEGAFVSALSHLVLPSVAVGTIPMAVVARMVRSSLLEVLGTEYIRAARARGLGPVRVVVIHALRNALIPVITVIGLQVGVLFAGAILTETVFAWPGIGKWIVDALGRRDYPVIQGGVLLIALVVVVVNLLTDLMYRVVDPRIRREP